MKRTLVITTLISIILLISGYIIASTYALFTSIDTNNIIKVENTSDEIIYNYLIDNLNLTSEEAKLVIDSINLNNTFKEIFNNLNLNDNEELNSSLNEVIDKDQNINNELKEKIKRRINK